MANKKSIGWVVAVMSSALLISACQPSAEKKQEQKEEQNSASEAVTESLTLTGTTQKVPIQLIDCDGNSCPEISIDRLSTNQFVFDHLIDEAILKQLDQILEIPKTEQSKETEKKSSVDAQRAASEAAASKTAVQLMSEQVQPFVNRFLALDKELKSLGVNHSINLTVSPKILNSEGPLATVVLNTSSYLGGAHGSSAQHYFNFDLKTQKQVELLQLLLPNQKTKLNELAHQAFKKWVMDSKLAENVDEYEQAWKFNLSDNYYMGKQGLILQYQEYEIGPYVVGLPRLVIPYDQLKGIIKDEYLLQTVLESTPPSTLASKPKAS